MTPPLTTLIKSLCEKSSSIKGDLCTALTKTDLAVVTAADINSCRKVSKLSLSKGVLDLTNIITNINNIINPVFVCEKRSATLNNICDTNYNQLQSDLKSKLASSSQIADAVDSAMKEHTVTIEKQLKVLNEAIAELNYDPLSSPEPGYCSEVTPPDITTKPVSHNLNPINDTIEDFITADMREELLDFFSKEEFVSEGGHGVVTYGERYKYMGHKT